MWQKQKQAIAVRQRFDPRAALGQLCRLQYQTSLFRQKDSPGIPSGMGQWTISFILDLEKKKTTLQEHKTLLATTLVSVKMATGQQSRSRRGIFFRMLLVGDWVRDWLLFRFILNSPETLPHMYSWILQLLFGLWHYVRWHGIILLYTNPRHQPMNWNGGIAFTKISPSGRTVALGVI